MQAVAALVLAAAPLLHPGIARATTAADLCPPTDDPCELTSEVTVTPGSALDFGERTFVIKAPTGRLQIQAGDTLGITARSMAIESGPGGRLRSAPGSSGGCRIDIETTGSFDVVRVTGPSIAIDLSSDDALCELRITAGGDVNIGADVRARGTGAADGGSLLIAAGGRVVVAGSIEADGAGAGGAVEIAATGPIDLQGTVIDVSSSEVGFGTIALDTGADLTIGTKLDLKGKGLCADGGLLFLSAAGDLTLTGSIDANGSGSPQFGGCFGAEISMAAGGSIFVNGPIDASGGAPDGAGGFLEDITAGVDFVQNAPIVLHGNGQFGVGGEATIGAARLLRLGALFDLNGGPQGGGGLLRVEGGETVEIAGEVGADGADFGRLAFATAPASALQVSGRITVTGEVHARSNVPEFEGDIVLEACEIEVAAGARIETSGATSRNLLRASDTMIVAGTLEAGAGVNELQHRDPAKPPHILGSAVVNPTPSITTAPTPPDVALRPCACTLTAGAPGVLCDDGNPCTQELCDATAGCSSVALAGEGIAGCDDGNVCDGREACVSSTCTPGTSPPADDGEPCTDDGTCDPVNGYSRTAKTGFGAASCRMDRIAIALSAASVPGDITARARQKIAALAESIRSLVERADGAGGKRRARLLRAAGRKAKKLERAIASPKSGIGANLAQILQLATTEVRATLSTL